MDFADYFPIWDKLTPVQREKISRSAIRRNVKKGTLLHNGSMDCLGLLLIRSGQLRAYIFSDEGREITIFRLFERDICLFSASCMMQSIQFDIAIEAEKDSEMWLIEQIMWKSFDRRLAAFLLEESALEDSRVLKITHEKIANHMGTAREVVTRMLRYFQNEGMVQLSRGTIEITDSGRLEELHNA